ncbi:unnamed protein product [Laminaria digitata]
MILCSVLLHCAEPETFYCSAEPETEGLLFVALCRTRNRRLAFICVCAEPETEGLHFVVFAQSQKQKACILLYCAEPESEKTFQANPWHCIYYYYSYCHCGLHPQFDYSSRWDLCCCRLE